MRPECLVLVILDVNANGLSPRYSFKGELPLTSVLLPFRKDPKCILQGVTFIHFLNGSFFFIDYPLISRKMLHVGDTGKEVNHGPCPDKAQILLGERDIKQIIVQLLI